MYFRKPQSKLGCIACLFMVLWVITLSQLHKQTAYSSKECIVMVEEGGYTYSDCKYANLEQLLTEVPKGTKIRFILNKDDQWLSAFQLAHALREHDLSDCVVLEKSLV